MRIPKKQNTNASERQVLIKMINLMVLVISDFNSETSIFSSVEIISQPPFYDWHNDF